MFSGLAILGRVSRVDYGLGCIGSVMLKMDGCIGSVTLKMDGCIGSATSKMNRCIVSLD